MIPPLRTRGLYAGLGRTTIASRRRVWFAANPALGAQPTSPIPRSSRLMREGNDYELIAYFEHDHVEWKSFEHRPFCTTSRSSAWHGREWNYLVLKQIQRRFYGGPEIGAESCLLRLIPGCSFDRFVRGFRKNADLPH